MEEIRTAVSGLQMEMEKFRSIMADATERHVDNAIKLGVTLAEVRLPFLLRSSSDMVAARPDVKACTWIGKIPIRCQ